MTAIRSRDGGLEALERLTDVDDRALRLHVAQWLCRRPAGKAAFERLRDEGIDPEASEAREWLEDEQRSADRPKPWGCK